MGNRTDSLFLYQEVAMDKEDVTGLVMVWAINLLAFLICVIAYTIVKQLWVLSLAVTLIIAPLLVTVYVWLNRR